MKRIDLIPKDKFDIETAKNLCHYSYVEVKEIVPELLEWLQDMNWPVARYVADYLLTILDSIENEILKILKGNDLIWIDWVLVVFGMHVDSNDVKNEIIRLAISPNENEKKEFLDETALEVTKNRNWI